MQFVAPALDGQVYDPAHAAAEFGGVGVGLHFELLDGVDRRLHHLGAASGGGKFDRVVVDAVHDVVVLADTLPAGGETADTGAGRRLHGAPRHQREVDVVAPVQRHVDDTLVVDHLALRGFHGVQPA